jgi:hypothetical protein
MVSTTLLFECGFNVSLDCCSFPGYLANLLQYPRATGNRLTLVGPLQDIARGYAKLHVASSKMSGCTPHLDDVPEKFRPAFRDAVDLLVSGARIEPRAPGSGQTPHAHAKSCAPGSGQTLHAHGKSCASGSGQSQPACGESRASASGQPLPSRPAAKAMPKEPQINFSCSAAPTQMQLIPITSHPTCSSIVKVDVSFHMADSSHDTAEVSFPRLESLFTSGRSLVS